MSRGSKHNRVERPTRSSAHDHSGEYIIPAAGDRRGPSFRGGKKGAGSYDVFTTPFFLKTAASSRLSRYPSHPLSAHASLYIYNTHTQYNDISCMRFGTERKANGALSPGPCALARVRVPASELRARTRPSGGPCAAARSIYYYATSSAVVGTAVPVCLAPWR